MHRSCTVEEPLSVVINGYLRAGFVVVVDRRSARYSMLIRTPIKTSEIKSQIGAAFWFGQELLTWVI